MVKAIIFDLDDTLISEKAYVKSGYKHVAKILSKDFKLNEKQTFEQLWSLFLQEPQMVFNRFLDAHIIEFYPDVLPLLEQLKKIDIKRGIVTDGFAVSQKQKLKVLNAAEYFDEIIVTDELGREYWKPHPKAFEVIAKRLDVEYEEMVYVGDNPQKDFYIGKIYPIRTVRILREESGVYKDAAYLEDVKENYLIYNLEELQDIVFW